MTREEQLLAAMVEAVDTLVDDFDLIDFLHQLCDRCNELLDVTAVGVMLADPNGRLHLIAASDEHTRLLELFALQTDQGPCVECHRSGVARLNIDLRVSARWPPSRSSPNAPARPASPPPTPCPCGCGSRSWAP